MKPVMRGVALLLAAAAFSVFAGTEGFAFPDPAWFMELRLPRLVLAIAVGAVLAVSGVTSQALLRNNLAEPYVLGVSGGAALGGVLGALIHLPVIGTSFTAVLGALAAASLVFAGGRSHTAYKDSDLLLQGVVFNAFAAAVVTVIKTLVSASQAQEILFWLMGQLAVYNVTLVILVSVVSAVVCLLMMRDARSFDALLAGDAAAHALGVDVSTVRRRNYWWLSIGVGVAVSVVGLIGFVGLVVPHLVRLMGASKHRPLMWASACVGASLLLVSDGLCRLGFSWFGTELPVGVLTAFLGAPFFVWKVRNVSRAS